APDELVGARIDRCAGDVLVPRVVIREGTSPLQTGAWSQDSVQTARVLRRGAGRDDQQRAEGGNREGRYRKPHWDTSPRGTVCSLARAAAAAGAARADAGRLQPGRAGVLWGRRY